MEKKEKRIFIYIAFAIALFAVVTHLDLVMKGITYLGSLIAPVFVGLVIAFILNVPVAGFEKLFARLFKKAKKKPTDKALHRVSILLAVICVVVVIALLFILVIPQLVNTVKSIAEIIEERWPSWVAKLESYNIDTAWLKEIFSNFDLKSLISKISGYAGTVLGSVTNVASSAMSVISLAVTGIIIALYTLADRNKLAVQSKKVLYAYVKTSLADRIVYICSLIKSAYTKFLSVQCLEAVLLGFLIGVAFAIFRLPYAILIGAVTAICALIPYIGALISCGLSVVLALMVSPQKALMCLIVYLAVQFIETQFIYPRLVGGSVGLSPLWTLVAVLVGGKLFGLIGMIFFIPFVSVVYILIREDVTKRLKAKENKAKYVI